MNGVRCTGGNFQGLPSLGAGGGGEASGGGLLSPGGVSLGGRIRCAINGWGRGSRGGASARWFRDVAGAVVVVEVDAWGLGAAVRGGRLFFLQGHLVQLLLQPRA